ncbi:MAG: NAD+ synthase [Balneolaceae bacterium]|nr:NAD+ synthase [Balneolaceae bacterium]
MKVRIQQINPIIGDLETNRLQIKLALKEAEESDTDLLILPEMVVCGYPPMDLVERRSFREAVIRVNQELIERTGETAVIFGTLTHNPSTYGRQCYNSAILAWRGEEVATVHKTLLPTYDVFDDLRYFEPNKKTECVSFRDVSLGITICEDIWYNENDIQYHTYETNPARELAEQGADAIINISASPFTKTKPLSRQEMLQGHAEELNLPIFYANQVGANTELIFDGDSMVIGADAQVIARSPLFEEHCLEVEWDPKERSVKNLGPKPELVHDLESNIFDALCLGLKDYLRKTGVSENVILGLSGGIDSTVVACIAAEALGADHVIGVTMPSEFSSRGSVTDSEALADNLGITLHEIAIGEIFDRFRNALDPVFGERRFGVAEENLQSRIRSAIIMSISNKFGYMKLNTGNKSELATGYCTLYGDMAGGLSVIGDLYKTEVYRLARWMNEKHYSEEMIPKNIMEKVPSAELRPDQKDSDFLPEYEVLDPILECYIEQQISRDEIVKQGYPADTVERVIRLVDRSEYKRFQAVPVLKVSTKSFGTGRRWPLVQGWTGVQL